MIPLPGIGGNAAGTARPPATGGAVAGSAEGGPPHRTLGSMSRRSRSAPSARGRSSAPRASSTRRSAEPDLPASERPVLRVGYIPGVEPDRFARRWRSGPRPARLELIPLPLSRQSAALAGGEVDMCFARLPLALADLPELHLVELWEERPMVVVGTENILSLHEELTQDDLAEDTEIPATDPDDAKDRVAVVATGVGHVVLPMSLARLHRRKDVVHRPLTDAPTTTIVLAWPRSADDAVRQEFVATVRGRTARSSR
jgi:hypothetical protein